MTPAITAPAPGAPGRLGPYQLVGVLGSGGMGTVYLGLGRRRRAAVKTVLPELLKEPGIRARFQREVTAAAAVRSAYLSSLLDSDLDGEIPWLATEFVPGPTLATAVERHGALPVPAVSALGGALARALAALGDAGVVHRDLKPSNVLLSADRPRVVDFGIARVRGDTTLTVTGQRPGSVGYMSPEQVLGGEVGPPSDVFTLGAVLAYAATGRHVYQGEHPAMASFLIAYEEPDLSGVPQALLPVVRRCLDRDPQRRPTPVELAGALDAQGAARRPGKRWLPAPVLDDASHIERAAARLAPVSKLLTRRRLLAGAGGAALLGGTAAFWYGSRGTGDGAQESSTAAPRWTGAPGEVPAPLWSRERAAAKPPFGPAAAGRAVLVAHAAGVVVAYDSVSGDERWRRARTEAVLGGEIPVLLENGVPVAVDAASGKERRRADERLSRLLAADGDVVYGTGSDGRIHALDLRDGRRRWRVAAPPGADGSDLTAAAGEGLLLLAGSGSVSALSAADGGVVWRRDTGARAGVTPALAEGLVVLGGEELTGVDPGDGSRLWSLHAEEDGGFGSPALDGGRVYVVDGSQLRAVDASRGSASWTVLAEEPLAASAAPLVAGAGVYAALRNPERGIFVVHRQRAAEQYRFTAAGSDEAPWRGTAAAGNCVVWQRGTAVHALPGL
ncbi:serine/threonine-protein kinase [Streptomyces sp. NPDC052309]|uniref:serine/threonine-protein kinase n=1 Tax=Streptomyces sp. NPDC052309 TaxID=3155421 RepID=UPI003442DF94